MVKKTPLPSQDELNALLRYEPETGKLYWRARTPDMFVSLVGENRTPEHACKIWNANFAGREALACLNNSGYKHGHVHRQKWLTHRLIWWMAYGELPEILDHINGDPGDNRLENLRKATCAENSQNMRRHVHNKTGVTGVSWDKAKQKWQARICCRLQQRLLGRFVCIGEAIACRKAAERELGFHENHGKVR